MHEASYSVMYLVHYYNVQIESHETLKEECFKFFHQEVYNCKNNKELLTLWTHTHTHTHMGGHASISASHQLSLMDIAPN